MFEQAYRYTARFSLSQSNLETNKRNIKGNDISKLYFINTKQSDARIANDDVDFYGHGAI